MINVYLLLLTGNGLTTTQSPRSLRLSLACPGLTARAFACYFAADEVQYHSYLHCLTGNGLMLHIISRILRRQHAPMLNPLLCPIALCCAPDLSCCADLCKGRMQQNFRSSEPRPSGGEETGHGPASLMQMLRTDQKCCEC